MTVDVEVLRKSFEAWVMSIEHKPYGWLGREWLDRHADSYMDDYVHGLWTAYQTRPVINEAFKWIDYTVEKPELGVQVFIRYARPWPYDFKTYTTTALLDKPFEDNEMLSWYNERGEIMAGKVSHWAPMVEVLP